MTVETSPEAQPEPTRQSGLSNSAVHLAALPAAEPLGQGRYRDAGRSHRRRRAAGCLRRPRMPPALEALPERQECELINNGESGPGRTGLPEGHEPGLSVRFVGLGLGLVEQPISA